MPRTAVVTGATAGVGLALSRRLAAEGWDVVLTARDADRGARAAAAVEEAARAAVQRGAVRVLPLDLADLASVEAAAGRLLADGTPLDRLVLNAGVMTPDRRTTADGFELMLGTNHLGHAALVGRLWPALAAHPGARVVVQSSEAHRHARLDHDDLQLERGFRAVPAYNRSKLALHLLGVELGRRAPFEVVVCQPGWVRSELGRSITSGAQRLAVAVGDRLVGQSPEEGARPAHAAVVRDDVPPAAGGDYLTPGGFQRLRGPVRAVRAAAPALDAEEAAWLWERTGELTGVALPGPRTDEPVRRG